MHVTLLHSLCGRGHPAFVTEAVSLDELLNEEALFGLSVGKVGVPRGRLFPSGLCLSAISRVVWARPDPLPTGLNGDGNKTLGRALDPRANGTWLSKLTE